MVFVRNPTHDLAIYVAIDCNSANPNLASGGAELQWFQSWYMIFFFYFFQSYFLPIIIFTVTIFLQGGIFVYIFCIAELDL